MSVVWQDSFVVFQDDFVLWATSLTIKPDAFALALTLETPTILFDATVTPDALALALTLETPVVLIDVIITPNDFVLEATLLSSDVLTGYLEIPPAILESLMDPYAGGAWLWLCEISIQGYERVRIARNTEDVIYCGITFEKSNFRLGLQPLTGDGSVPRISLQVLQDRDRVLEDIINETQGAGGGTVKVIRTHEEFLTRFVKDLEANFDVLTAESDTEWVTFTLGIPNPLMRKMPLRLNSSKRCPYALPGLFKGPDCQYAGLDLICTGTYDDCLTKGNAVHWGAEMGLDPNTIRV